MPPRLLGQLSILLSAFFFYGATVVIERSTHVEAISSSAFVTGRFLIGLVYAVVVSSAIRRFPRAIDPRSLVTRALSNCVAVWCFYRAVQLGGPAVGNSLNMSYPVFLALFALFLGKGDGSRGLIASLLAFGGIIAILRPGEGVVDGGIIGLISGIFAAVSVASLESTRKHHDTTTVLFYVHGIGSVIMVLLFWPDLLSLSSYGVSAVVVSSTIGMIGQIFFTYGAKFISSVENGIISSLRILIAVMCAPLLEIGSSIGTLELLGAALLFGANVLVITSKKPQPGREEAVPS